ncbi:uncharacterized protein LOC130543007 [Ursus arctos]|uniref:uncharacterized protein LOC130543007 n=1 Tax=Ursus arctos TaxID=9644 RepID=UPI002547654D|nr:uncharacterized protein LOC130543007 [Ursus arctos]
MWSSTLPLVQLLLPPRLSPCAQVTAPPPTSAFHLPPVQDHLEPVICCACFSHWPGETSAAPGQSLPPPSLCPIHVFLAQALRCVCVVAGRLVTVYAELTHLILRARNKSHEVLKICCLLEPRRTDGKVASSNLLPFWGVLALPSHAPEILLLLREEEFTEQVNSGELNESEHLWRCSSGLKASKEMPRPHLLRSPCGRQNKIKQWGTSRLTSTWYCF